MNHELCRPSAYYIRKTEAIGGTYLISIALLPRNYALDFVEFVEGFERGEVVHVEA